MSDIDNPEPVKTKAKRPTKKEAVKEEKTEKIKRVLKKKEPVENSDSEDDILHVVLPKKKVNAPEPKPEPQPIPKTEIIPEPTQPIPGKLGSGLKLKPDIYDFLF